MKWWGGGRDSNHGLCLYTHTHAFRVWRYLHGIAPCFSSRRSIHQPHSVISPYRAIVLKKFNRRPMTIHTLVHLCIYVSAAGRIRMYPIHPSSFHIAHSILNHGIEIKWNKRGKSNILLYNISSRAISYLTGASVLSIGETFIHFGTSIVPAPDFFFFFSLLETLRESNWNWINSTRRSFLKKLPFWRIGYSPQFESHCLVFGFVIFPPPPKLAIIYWLLS